MMKKTLSVMVLIVFAAMMVACEAKKDNNTQETDSVVTPTVEATPMPEITKEVTPTSTPIPTPTPIPAMTFDDKCLDMVEKIMEQIPGYHLSDEDPYDFSTRSEREFCVESNDGGRYYVSVYYRNEEIIGAYFDAYPYYYYFDEEGMCIISERIGQNAILEPELEPVDEKRILLYRGRDIRKADDLKEAVSWQDAVNMEPFTKEYVLEDGKYYKVIFTQTLTKEGSQCKLNSSVIIREDDSDYGFGNVHELMVDEKGNHVETVRFVNLFDDSKEICRIYKDENQNQLCCLQMRKMNIPAGEGIGYLSLSDANGEICVDYDFDRIGWSIFDDPKNVRTGYPVAVGDGGIACEVVFCELQESDVDKKEFSYSFDVAPGHVVTCDFTEYLREGAYSGSPDMGEYYEWGLEVTIKLDGKVIFDDKVLTPM